MDVAGALLDAEDQDAAPKGRFEVDERAMTRLEREGLCRQESLEIFVTWYNFGGASHGLSLSEILTMPSWLRKDFAYIFRVMGQERADRRSFEQFVKKSTKKGKR